MNELIYEFDNEESFNAVKNIAKLTKINYEYDTKKLKIIVKPNHEHEKYIRFYESTLTI